MHVRSTRIGRLSVWAIAVALVAATAAPAAAQFTRVSVGGANEQADAASSRPSVSGDGRYVVFESDASNLVANDTNGASDVFLKDRQTGTVTRVSTPVPVGPGGDSRLGVISTDGRFVAFMSTAPLIAEDTNQCTPAGGALVPCWDIYVYERASGALTRVSVSSTGVQSNGASTLPDISGDGRYVVFESEASNLVDNDTNGASDVFLHDRQTGQTTRLSVTSGGAQNPLASRGASISDDGDVIAFLSPAGAELDPSLPPTAPCFVNIGCHGAFVRVRSANTTTRVPIVNPIGDGYVSHTSVTVSPNGTYLAVSATSVGAFNPVGLFLFNRLTGHTFTGLPQSGFDANFSGNGRFLSFCNADGSGGGVLDLVTQVFESVAPGRCPRMVLSSDGFTAFFHSTDNTLVPLDTNAVLDVFAFDRDVDDDGMLDSWETYFGLDPTGPGDATLDPDNDGVTTLEEFVAGTHPKGTFKRFLAEGASNNFFETTVSLLLPGDVAPATRAAVTVRYLGANGQNVSQALTLTQGTPVSLFPRPPVVPGPPPLFTLTEPGTMAQPLPDQSFSTVVESDRLIVVERSMTWHQTANAVDLLLGSHSETAIDEPRTAWYFAEGATHGAFDLFYLIQNPQNVDTQVQVSYFLPAPQAPITRTYMAPARSRLTIWVDAETGLGETDVSAQITSTHPVFVERAMYFSTPGQAFTGGHAGAGIAQPLTQWFVAESVTGGFFDSFLLIGNANVANANLTVSYFLEDGTTFDKNYVAPARSRLTIGLDSDDPRLANTSLSAHVRSTNDVPVVVERATFWPQGQWYEGTLTAASAAAGRRWAFARGPIGPTLDTLTFLLIANPTGTAGTATIKLASEGSTPVVCDTSVAVPAHSRVTVNVAEACDLDTARVMGGTVESSGPDIVVERASYRSAFVGTNVPAIFWALGEAVALTRLPQ